MIPTYTTPVGLRKICLAFDWPTQMKIPRTAPAPTPYLIGGTTIFECFRNSWELRDCVLIKGSMRQLRLIYDLNDNLLL